MLSISHHTPLPDLCDAERLSQAVNLLKQIADFVGKMEPPLRRVAGGTLSPQSSRPNNRLLSCLIWNRPNPRRHRACKRWRSWARVQWIPLNSCGLQRFRNDWDGSTWNPTCWSTIWIQSFWMGSWSCATLLMGILHRCLPGVGPLW